MRLFYRVITTVALSALIISSSYAQTDKGTLTMELTDVASDNEQMAAGLEMMKGTSMIVTFTDKKSMSKLDMMGGMIKTDIMIDPAGDLNMYMDMMGRKIWVAATKAEQDLMKAKNPEANDFDIAYDKSDTKEIAGFKCYKMTVTSPANPDMELTAYITEDIDINAQVIQNMDINQFDGFPLEYTMNTGMMRMTFSTTAYEPTVDLSVFDVDQSQYKKMTMEEFQSQMGSMGGGMGF